MNLWTDRGEWKSASHSQIKQTLSELKVDEFAILGSGEEVYIQTMRLADGWVLEKRDGGADRHFEAIPKDGRARITPDRPWWAFWSKPEALSLFKSEEVLVAFLAYADGNCDPDHCTWHQIWM